MEKIKNHFNYKIETDPVSISPVEIIIPFHGQTHCVTKLIDGIFKTVRDIKYMITLVDDGSANTGFLSSLVKANVPGLRGIKNFKHSGFGYSVNQALRNPFSREIPWVVIMHSDVEVEQPTWLYNLNKTINAMKENGVKMVTAMTDNPTNDLLRLKKDKNEVLENFILDEDEFIPMYCCIAHRELFNRIGPLYECPYAGSEVQEFALRMRKQGFFQGVSGESWVHHEGGKTLDGFIANEKAQEAMENARNKILFS